jgi:Uri superfamily endonuclease
VNVVAQADSDTPKVSPILARMKRPRDAIKPRWGVYFLQRKAERKSFTVTERDSEEAIARAIKEFEIPERDRWRPSVQREG